MRLLFEIMLLLVLVGLLGVVSQSAHAQTSTYEELLAERNIGTDPKSLAKYLKDLHPTQQQRDEVDALIRQLGDPANFKIREDAMAKLMIIRNLPNDALLAATAGDDPEIRWRAQQVLDNGNPESTALMHAAFQVIAAKKSPGVTAELLAAIPLCASNYMQAAARRATEESARPEDASLLREALQSEVVAVRVTAASALGKSLGNDARNDLVALLKDDEEQVKLAAARALANQGDRTSLTPLVELLDSKTLKVRITAMQTLRQVTGKQHKYVAYENAEARKDAVVRWAEWVDDDGRTSKLNFPLKNARFEFGRTLIAIYGQNRVIELDASGKEVWKKEGLDQPWGCIGLPNGHRVISNYRGRYVVEYDAGGKEVWRKDDLPESPFNVRRLDNGNTLVACTNSNKVVEIRPDKSTAWEIAIDGRPMEARRLENGMTLVTLQNGGRVVEVDRDGKVQWELTGLKNPITAQRLDNGTTLVAEVGGGRVAQWSREGKVVWEHDGLTNPYCAQRLANGNTLIVHGKDVREVNEKSEIIWQKTVSGVAHACRY